MPLLPERLLIERERMGLSQQQLADACGITIRSQRNYEKGERAPDSDYLSAFAEAGGDVLFVLTGHAQSGNLAGDPAEQVLLDSYRRCAAQAKQTLIQTAALLSAGLAQPSSGLSGTKQVMKNNGSGSVQIGSVGNIGGDYNPLAPRKAPVKKSKPPSR